MKTCRSCQSANLDGASACSVCGQDLDGYEIPVAPPAPPAAPPGVPTMPPTQTGWGAPQPPTGPPTARDWGAPNPAAQPGTHGPPTGYGAPPVQPGAPQHLAGPPGATVYAPPGTPGGYVQSPPTNNMAVASLVLSIIGACGMFLCFLPMVLAPVGAVLGHVSLSQIKKTGQGGRGMALSGVIVGWIATAIFLAIVVFYIVALSTSTTY
ncbi:MAG: DUF4190 domain-containing protein [Microthrixaceae bacterium]